MNRNQTSFVKPIWISALLSTAFLLLGSLVAQKSSVAQTDGWRRRAADFCRHQTLRWYRNDVRRFRLRRRGD